MVLLYECIITFCIFYISWIYLHFKMPSKQLHWLDSVLFKFITYYIVKSYFEFKIGLL